MKVNINNDRTKPTIDIRRFITPFEDLLQFHTQVFTALFAVIIIQQGHQAPITGIFHAFQIIDKLTGEVMLFQYKDM